MATECRYVSHVNDTPRIPDCTGVRARLRKTIGAPSDTVYIPSAAAVQGGMDVSLNIHNVIHYPFLESLNLSVIILIFSVLSYKVHSLLFLSHSSV